MITAIVPDRPCGHSLVVIEDLNPENALLSCANQNAFVFDFVARQKTPGVHLNLWIWKQLPLLGLVNYGREFGGTDLRAWIAARVLELTYTAWDLEAFALDCAYAGPPFRWDEDRRFLLRCELDAAYFHLYLGSPAEWGMDYPQLSEMFPNPRDAVDYIMDTFPIVKRKDIAKHGDYRTKLVILHIYDQMQRQSRLANRIRRCLIRHRPTLA